MNIGDIIPELNREDLEFIDKNLHKIDLHVLNELHMWYKERFSTEDSSIKQDIKFKKIIKELYEMIKEKEFVDGI